MTTPTEREYFLGTGNLELERLGLQHAVWRADAAAAWREAEFRPGSVVMDVGCGPGFASLELADVVRPNGKVLAVDQSERFLAHLNDQCRSRGVTNITTLKRDLTTFTFDDIRADGAWLRWVLAFLPDPEHVLARIADALRPGASIAIHEYFAYETWKLVPADPVFESFVAAVMASWRAHGGEPNVGLKLAPWLEGAGLRITSTRTMTELVTPMQHRWYWPATFAHSGLERLVHLGDVTPADAERMRERFQEMWARGTRMMTPGVIEVIATKPV